MPSTPMHRRPGFLLALGLCVIGGAVTLLGHLAVGPQTEVTRVPLPNVAGTEACPSFSPNGRHLAYSAHGADPKEPFHIWIRALPSGAPQQLTEGPSSDICPVWSPDGGSLAFQRIADDQMQYVVIPSAPQAGGAERKIAEFAAPEDAARRVSVAWLRDGKTLLVIGNEAKQPAAVFAATLDGGTPRQITHPGSGSAGDSYVTVSPDGKTVAFFRAVADGEAGDIWLCDPSGGSLRQLTFDTRPIRGIAWTADGHDIVFASPSRAAHKWQLWRIPAFGGSAREVLLGAREINDPVVAPAGNRMAYTQTPTMSAIWIAPLPAGENPHTRPILRSPGREAFPSWSPDGKQIAFVSDESGTDEIWVSGADGSNRAQVTNLKGPSLSRPRWSPDGGTLLFSARGPQNAAYTIAATARNAQPRPLKVSPGASGLCWSHDGKAVYGEWRGAIWKFPRDGEPKPLTEHIGAMSPEESPDGKYVYYFFRRTIWRVASDGGFEEEAVSPDQWVSSLQPVAKGIYYMAWERRRRMEILFYDFATKKTTDVLSFNDAEISRDSTFDVSPDGKYILYPKIDRTQTDLVLVENFR